MLLYTDHYRRTFGTEGWERGPGLSEAAARWLGEQRIAAFGVETEAPGVRKVSNRGVHLVCGRAGLHALRKLGEPAPAGGQGALPIHRVAAEDPQRDGLTRAGGGGVRSLS